MDFHLIPNVLPFGLNRYIMGQALFVRDIAWTSKDEGRVVETGTGPVRFKRVKAYSLDEWSLKKLREIIITNVQKLEPGEYAFEQQPLLMLYEKGDTFGWHSDSHYQVNGEWVPNPDRLKYQVSVVIWLNDGFKGGALEFDTGESYQPTPETLVVFDSKRVHRVAPVKDGRRWAISAFLSRS